jgi:methylmalonyl-CoA mutase N-terminal domain/subunit
VNNVVRPAVEALAAVLGGTNSLHTNALDETLALPTAESAEIALRTQQVIMEETGVTAVADPLGGSWFVEHLTDRVEADAEHIFATLLDMGGDGTFTSGILRGIEDGWFNAEIADAAFAYQQALEKGDKHVVGVTDHTETITTAPPILRVSGQVETDQRAALAERRAARDESAVTAALDALRVAAQGSSSTIRPMLDAARAEATLGEICDVLREEWGTYTEPARF